MKIDLRPALIQNIIVVDYLCVLLHGCKAAEQLGDERIDPDKAKEAEEKNKKG